MRFFITIEGGEGSGKSSQAAAIGAMLSARGLPHVLTYEPGGTAIGEEIRRTLLDKRHTMMDPLAEVLLYLASRRQHIVEVIEPALAAGKIVVCDRFEDSSLVYQGLARGLGLDSVRTLSRKSGIHLKPDLTILLDLPPDAGLLRARGRPQSSQTGDTRFDPDTRFENEDLAFHEAVHRGYQQVAAEEPHRFVVIDAGRPLAVVTARVVAAVEERLEGR